MKKWIGIGWCGLAATLLLSLVCACDPTLPPGETVGQWLWYDRAALVAAACIGVGVLWAGKGGGLSLAAAVSWALMGWASVQAVWGMCQLFGLAPSGHALYALTGSFFNPGPYSGYLAMALPVCLHEYLCRQQTDPAGRYAAALAGLLILCVLPAGMSRSAWLAAGVSCGWVYGRHRGWRQRLRAFRQRKPGLFRGAVAGVCAVVCLGGLGLYQLKPDSALGRLFMARMSARAVWAEPWTGHGAGSFAAAYGEAQEAYFAAGRHAAWEERVAGSPEYAFNEYLQAAVEGGIPLTLLLLAGIGCYMLFADGESGAEVYSCATTRDQARVCFETAQEMVRRCSLSRRAKVFRSAGGSISYEATGSVFKPLSSDANTLDGKNASCTIVDEFHAHKTDEVYAVIQHTGDSCGLAYEQVVHKGMPVHGVLLAPLLVDVWIAYAVEQREEPVELGGLVFLQEHME